MKNANTLPNASTLCGACYEVCPVKINIPEVLLHLRGQVTRLASPLTSEALAMRELAHIFASPKRYEQTQRLARRGQGLFVHEGVIDSLPGMLVIGGASNRKRGNNEHISERRDAHTHTLRPCRCS